MKKYLFLMLLGLFSVVVNAQQKPEIKFVTEEIDYGTIKKGSDGLRVFEFTSVGEAPLIIVDSHSSCGCTVPTIPKNKPFAKGESGKIEVKYNTNIVGTIRKTITIETNGAGTIALRIKGTVVEE